MRRQSQDGGDVNVQTYNNLQAIGNVKTRKTTSTWGAYYVGRPEERLPWNEVNTPVPEVDPVTSNSQWDYFSMHVRRPSLTPDGQPLSLLHQIAEVALDIKEASETVLQHKEDCIELDKRVSRVSALLSKLKNTEMVEKQAMKNELKKLLQTFQKRHCHHVRLQPALHAIQTAKRIIGSTGASRECYNCSHCQ
uniref:Uncharacterized protein n=1 Tax=Setaria viridis TaxID=4556 RepID=A0A4U6VGE0_SETVI|nr:hypothetical protein SEVIR_3G333800v2 [Setaria viridis]